MRIARLEQDQLAELLGARALFDSPPSPRAARAYLEDERNVFLLAKDADAPVGFLRGTALRQIRSVRRQMFLYEIGVTPSRRRRGVGRALVQALLEYCRTHDFEEVFVFTDPTNVGAVGLYRSTGAETETAADRMFVYRLDTATRSSDPR